MQHVYLIYIVKADPTSSACPACISLAGQGQPARAREPPATEKSPGFDATLFDSPPGPPCPTWVGTFQPMAPGSGCGPQTGAGFTQLDHKIPQASRSSQPLWSRLQSLNTLGDENDELSWEQWQNFWQLFGILASSFASWGSQHTNATLAPAGQAKGYPPSFSDLAHSRNLAESSLIPRVHFQWSHHFSPHGLFLLFPASTNVPCLPV